jgi:hypothetical protein
MSQESVPVPANPEQPPLAPYDPPDPAPQADAWRRAIKVVAGQVPRNNTGLANARSGRSRTHLSKLR